MRISILNAILAAALMTLGSAFADSKVAIGCNHNDSANSGFEFSDGVPNPSKTDAATDAKFTIVDGKADEAGGGLEKLHDGQLPDDQDEPSENFFFSAGSNGGRLQVDLNHAIEVKEVNTYSWHPGSRGPQNYNLYAAEGTESGFNAKPKRDTAPDSCGWKLIATIDTRSQGKGGQFGVSISSTNGTLGKFRYLLFDVSPTERNDAFGNTFFSEIDVIDADGESKSNSPATAAAGDFTIKSSDGSCTIDISTKDAPDLKDWAEHDLAPALADWYPKITDMLASTNYQAPTHFRVTLKPTKGVAFTSGREVVANSDWVKKGGRNAIGALVHEEVHVVQQYHSRSTPGWLQEGIPDYIRFFKYEPQSHGADLEWLRRTHQHDLRYNGSYRISANFLDWVVNHYDKDIIKQLNAVLRAGKYDDNIWKELTGKDVKDLGAEWVKDVEAQISAPQSGTSADKK
jgi:hypothetical protein